MKSISGSRVLTSNWFIIFCFYCAAYGFMLLNTSVFFDDYVTSGFHTGFNALLNTYTELGFFLHWPAYLHGFFFGFGDPTGVFLERLVIFLAYLLSGLLLDATLRNIAEIKALERLFIVVLFAVLPVNAARIALCNIHYALSSLLFFAGLRFLAAFCNTGSVFARITALVLFFISFSTSSLLMFYLIGILYLVYAKWESVKTRPWVSALKHMDLLALPLIFWFIKGKLFPASGVYAGYNTITLAGLFSAPLFSLSAIGSVSELLNRVLVSSGFFSVLAALLLAAVYTKYRVDGTPQSDPGAHSTRLLMAGLIILMAGIFPYAAVFKTPGPGWDSRHGLLLPLGAAFVLVYGVKELFRVLGVAWSPVRVCFVYFLAALAFTAADAGAFYRFLQQDYKNQSLVANFKDSAIVRDHTTFIFQDETKDYNGMPEAYRAYEYSGLFMLAFGDQKRIGYWNGNYENEFGEFKELGLFGRPAETYKLKDYIPVLPQYKIVIVKGSYPLNDIALLRLTMRRFIQPERVRQNIRDILRLEYAALPGK